MAYAGISALLSAEDQRSHLDWVNAFLHAHYPDLWENPPEGLKEGLAGLLDLAAERALAQATKKPAG